MRLKHPANAVVHDHSKPAHVRRQRAQDPLFFGADTGRQSTPEVPRPLTVLLNSKAGVGLIKHRIKCRATLDGRKRRLVGLAGQRKPELIEAQRPPARQLIIPRLLLGHAHSSSVFLPRGGY